MISLNGPSNNLLKVPLPKGDLGGSGLRNDELKSHHLRPHPQKPTKTPFTL